MHLIRLNHIFCSTVISQLKIFLNLDYLFLSALNKFFVHGQSCNAFAHATKCTTGIAKNVNAGKKSKRLTKKILLDARYRSTHKSTLTHAYFITESLGNTHLNIRIAITMLT